MTAEFPVLSAGPTPHTALDLWDFSIVGELAEPRGWTWEEFRALPSEEITRDIHCVTKWTKLNTVWRGVSVDTLLEGIETAAELVDPVLGRRLHDHLPLEDVTGGKARVVFAYAGQPLAPTRRPRAHARPAALLLEERQVGTGRPRQSTDEPGFWSKRLPQLRRPMAGTALRGRLTWQLAELAKARGRRIGHRATDGDDPDARRRRRHGDAVALLYACGPTPFVEAVAESLVRLGHDTRAIKTERFGPTGR